MDLISRQAAIEVLAFGKEMLGRVLDDMDVVGTDREKYSWGLVLIESYIYDIEELPSAQPEIIRCKDCKHRDAENGFCEGRGWPMQLVPDDGFCDKGERSEE